jgi:hypothetical protein
MTDEKTRAEINDKHLTLIPFHGAVCAAILAVLYYLGALAPIATP